MPRSKTPSVCPVCGEDVPRGAKACPECGACEKTGWKEEASYLDGADLADDEETFDYDEFVKREFEGKTPAPHRLHYGWIVTAIILLVVLFWSVWRWSL